MNGTLPALLAFFFGVVFTTVVAFFISNRIERTQEVLHNRITREVGALRRGAIDSIERQLASLRQEWQGQVEKDLDALRAEGLEETREDLKREARKLREQLRGLYKRPNQITDADLLRMRRNIAEATRRARYVADRAVKE